DRSHIITADIGVAPLRAQTIFSTKTRPTKVPPVVTANPRQMPIADLKVTLRRLSKMVLAGYGGASLLFFGVPLTSAAAGRLPSGAPQVKAEEAQLTNAVNASEAEAAGDGSGPNEAPAQVEYSWWDVLLGNHDHEIFEKFAQAPNDKMKADIKIGREHLMPRFWVLTDHSRGQVVLVLRGTMSLNEIAVDLTCDSEEFEPATTEVDEEMESHRDACDARAMGEVGKPMQLAGHETLY
ncbi:hypothetical protein MPER_03944, partial [Moniliophthora perniciosa FA553]